jgi:hypothetical protein
MRKLTLSVTALAMVLASCGGGGGTHGLPVAQQQKAPAGTTKLNIVLPKGQHQLTPSASIFPPALAHHHFGVIKLAKGAKPPTPSAHARKPAFVDATVDSVLNITSQAIDPGTGAVVASTSVTQTLVSANSTISPIPIAIYAGNGLVNVVQTDASTHAVLAQGQASYTFDPTASTAVNLDIALSLVPANAAIISSDTTDFPGGTSVSATTAAPVFNTVNVSNFSCGESSPAGQSIQFSVNPLDADNVAAASGDGATPSVTVVTNSSPLTIGGQSYFTHSDNGGKSTITPVSGSPGQFVLSYDGEGNGVNALFRVVSGFGTTYANANLGDTCTGISFGVLSDDGGFDTSTNTEVFQTQLSPPSTFFITETNHAATITVTDPNGQQCQTFFNLPALPFSESFDSDVGGYDPITIGPSTNAQFAGGCSLNFSDGTSTVILNLDIDGFLI